MCRSPGSKLKGLCVADVQKAIQSSETEVYISRGHRTFRNLRCGDYSVISILPDRMKCLFKHGLLLDTIKLGTATSIFRDNEPQFRTFTTLKESNLRTPGPK